MPGAHAEAFDLMRLVMAAAGVSASSLTLRQDGASIRASLNVRGFRGLAAVDVDPCNGLLAACRMKLPILVRSQPASRGSIPDIYHPLLESLGLDGCGGPGAA